MKPKNLFINILAVVLVFRVCGMFAQKPAITIEVLAAFDYPGDGNATTPFGINQRGDIAGRYLDTSGVTRGNGGGSAAGWTRTRGTRRRWKPRRVNRCRPGVTRTAGESGPKACPACASSTT